jgi:hypothetical protein
VEETALDFVATYVFKKGKKKGGGGKFFQAKYPLQSNPSSQVRHYTVLQY